MDVTQTTKQIEGVTKMFYEHKIFWKNLGWFLLDVLLIVYYSLASIKDLCMDIIPTYKVIFHLTMIPLLIFITTHRFFLLKGCETYHDEL